MARYTVSENSLASVQQLRSPNQDDRPMGTEIDLVVIHGISLPLGQYGGPWINALFTNTLPEVIAESGDERCSELCQLRVSAHLLVRRDGEVIQYVAFDKRAWHAGVSSFKNREACNDFSIGIELEGCDDQPYQHEQYQSLAEVLCCLMVQYPGIKKEHIVGHSAIAPGRKTDPGAAFDWPCLYTELQQCRTQLNNKTDRHQS